MTVLILSLIRVGSQDPLVTSSWTGKRESALNAKMHEVTLAPSILDAGTRSIFCVSSKWRPQNLHRLCIWAIFSPSVGIEHPEKNGKKTRWSSHGKVTKKTKKKRKTVQFMETSPSQSWHFNPPKVGMSDIQ